MVKETNGKGDITMARERESYRDNLERIIERFPGKEVLSVSEVSKYLKKDPRTVKRILPFKKGLGISIVTLARCLS